MKDNVVNLDLESFLNENPPHLFKVRTVIEIQERIDEMRYKAYLFEGKTLDFVLFQIKSLDKILVLYEIFEYNEDRITDFFCKEYMKMSRMAEGERKGRYLKVLSYLLSDKIRKQLISLSVMETAKSAVQMEIL